MYRHELCFLILAYQIICNYPQHFVEVYQGVGRYNCAPIVSAAEMPNVWVRVGGRGVEGLGAVNL